jgi:hypothetical protein
MDTPARLRYLAMEYDKSLLLRRPSEFAAPLREIKADRSNGTRSSVHPADRDVPGKGSATGTRAAQLIAGVTVPSMPHDDDRPHASRGLSATQGTKVLVAWSLTLMPTSLLLGLGVNAATEGRLLVGLAFFVLSCALGSGLMIWFSTRGWLPHDARWSRRW